LPARECFRSNSFSCVNVSAKVPIEKLEVLNNFAAIVVAMDQQHGT